MRDNINEMVDVVLNRKVETPSSIDPGLPNVPGFIVFLRPE